jgi:large subunit ribosomal protein L30
MSGSKMLRITYVKSAIGYRQDQRDTLRSLGLRRLHQTVEKPDTPSIRGMINKVRHLVRVEEVMSEAAPTGRGRTRASQKGTEDEAT